MATPDFYDENRNRSFPFRRLSVGYGTPATGPFTMRQLPDSAIVDCGFVLGPESGFDEETHTVYLQRIERIDATTVEYEFRCDTAPLATKPLIFTRTAASPHYALEFAESDNAEDPYVSADLSYSYESNDCGEPYWSGYLVTGSVSDLLARLAIAVPVLRTSSNETLVEPGLLQNLNRNQVITLNVANADRTRALRPAGCPQNHWPFPVNDIYIRKTCIQGDVRLRPGYNVAIAALPVQNLIRFSAVKGAGLGTPCEEVKLFPGETGPVGNTNGLLGGDFLCNEVFRTVNGISGPDIKILTGPGVAVSAAPHTVIVDVNLQNLQNCGTTSASSGG